MPQISTTGQLENASKEMIDTARFTAEHEAPVFASVSHFSLKKGEDTGIFPKVGQMTMSDLNEGQDMVAEQDIGMTTVSVTTSEVGAKVILSDKLLRQNSKANFQMVGRQLGDGMKRKRERDIIALFSALNGGTGYGSAGTAFSSANVTGIVSTAVTDKVGSDGGMTIVHHPNAVSRLARDVSTIGSGQIRPLPEGLSARLVGSAFQGIMIWSVPVLQTAEIDRDGSDDGIGAIYSKDALGVLSSLQPTVERERDASLRAWEVNIVADYAAFELDDTRGVGLTYDAADPSTTA
jgi:hypothetical protein